MLHIFREIGEEILKVLFKTGKGPMLLKRIDVNLSVSPAIKASFESQKPELEDFRDANVGYFCVTVLDDSGNDVLTRVP